MNRLRRILKFSLFAFGSVLIGDYSAYNGKVTSSNDPAHPVGSMVSSGSSTSPNQSNAAAVAATNKANTPSAPATGGAQSAANSFGASDGTYYPTAAARDAHQATINAAHGVATTAPAATTPTTTAPTTTAPASSTDASTQSLLTQLQTYISSMLPSQTANNAPSSAQIGTLANQYAQLQVDPQLTALQNQLATAQTQTASQIAQIQAANSQANSQTTYLLNQVHQQADDDAAARGAGNSGVGLYDYQQMAIPVENAVDTNAAQEQAQLSGAASNLQTEQQNIGNQTTALGTQQGQIASQYAESLNEYYTSAANQSFQGMVNAALALEALGAQMATSGSVTPGTVGVGASGQAQTGLPVGTTVDTAGGNYTITGTNPSGGYTSVPATGTTTTAAPATSSAPTELSTAVTAAGGTITWDQATGNVTINGKVYTKTDLQRMGGTLNADNHWYLPQSVINSLI